jgi:hypothetical protein
VTRKSKLTLGLALLVVAIIAGWPIASCEWANFELRQDLRDLSAQGAAQIGLAPPKSDDDLRSAVIGEAKHEEIQLQSDEVTVRRTGPVEAPILYLAADYRVPVGVLGFPFTLHYTASSAK